MRKGKCFTKNNEAILYSFAIVLLSLLTIAVCSKSSFLYPINDWGDANIYFEIAKGIKHGMVPFRDLYDQKGPLIYFIYLAGILFNEKSFIGIYVLEVIAASIFLITAYKAINLYCKDKISILVLPLIACAVYSSKAMCQGGSAEEFIIPIYMLILYKLLVFYNSRNLKQSDSIIIGILCGMIFWIKFTLVLFPILFALYVIYVYLREKNVKDLLMVILNVLLGVMIITLPILLYFVANGSLMYLWEGYFYNNIFLYNHTSESFSILKYLWWYKTHIMEKNTLVFILMCVGMGYMILKKQFRLLILSLAIYVFINIELYAGGNCYDYYPLTASICCIPGCIAITRLLTIIREKLNLQKIHISALYILLCIASVICSTSLTTNKKEMFMSKSDSAPYILADAINANSTDDNSIYVYGLMDRGFYLAMDQLPSNRFFCKTNLSLDQMLEEQDKYVESQEAKYIITFLPSADSDKVGIPDFVESAGYTEIKRLETNYERKNYTYLLFMKN